MKTPKEIIDKYFPSGLHEDPEQSELNKIFIFNAMEEYASQFKSQSEGVGDPYNELRWPAIASERALREANEKHKPTITDGNKSEFYLAWRLCLEWVQKYYYLSAKVSVGEEKKDLTLNQKDNHDQRPEG